MEAFNSTNLARGLRLYLVVIITILYLYPCTAFTDTDSTFFSQDGI